MELGNQITVIAMNVPWLINFRDSLLKNFKKCGKKGMNSIILNGMFLAYRETIGKLRTCSYEPNGSV